MYWGIDFKILEELYQTLIYWVQGDYVWSEMTKEEKSRVTKNLNSIYSIETKRKVNIGCGTFYRGIFTNRLENHLDYFGDVNALVSVTTNRKVALDFSTRNKSSDDVGVLVSIKTDKAVGITGTIRDIEKSMIGRSKYGSGCILELNRDCEGEYLIPAEILDKGLFVHSERPVGVGFGVSGIY